MTMTLEEIFKKCSFFPYVLDAMENPHVKKCIYNGIAIINLHQLFRIPANEWIYCIGIWEDTRQGIDYWEDINEAWCRFVETSPRDFSIIAEWYRQDNVTYIDSKEDKIGIFKKCSFYAAFKDEYGKDCSNSEPIDEFLAGMECASYIYFAFDWPNAKNGHEYWRAINYKWQEFCRTGDLQIISEYYKPESKNRPGHQDNGKLMLQMPEKPEITLDFKL